MKDNYVCEESRALTEERSALIKLTAAFYAALCILFALVFAAALTGFLGEEDLPNILFLCAVLLLVAICVILFVMIFRRIKKCKELAKRALCRYLAHTVGSVDFLKSEKAVLEYSSDKTPAAGYLLPVLRKNAVITVKDINSGAHAEFDYGSVMALRFYSMGAMDSFELTCQYFAAECYSLSRQQKLPNEVTLVNKTWDDRIEQIVSGGQLIYPVNDDNPFIKYQIIK